MTLDDVSRYAKVLTRANDATQGDEGTRTAARNIARGMEAEHPGIAAAYARVNRALTADSRPGSSKPAQNMDDPPGSPFAGWREAMFGAATAGAAKFAEGFATDLLDEHGRQSPLAKDVIVVKRREAGEGQVCVEVRFRACDGERKMRSFLRAIESELLDAIDGV